MSNEAEFEEKEYEGPLNHQLAAGSSHLWPPGQVLKEHLGIDAAMWVGSQSFWRQVGYHLHPTGAALAHFNFGYVWRRIGHSRPLPTFSCNLFIQVKRPEVLKQRNATMKTLGLKSPYWRFSIKPHQQNALDLLSRKLGNRALVAYACAAFDTLDDLYRHIQNQALIPNSTFVRSVLLQGHAHWNYHQAGTSGVACSEPRFVSERPFLEQIVSLAVEASANPQRAQDSIDSAASHMTRKHRLPLRSRERCSIRS